MLAADLQKTLTASAALAAQLDPQQHCRSASRQKLIDLQGRAERVSTELKNIIHKRSWSARQ